MPQIWMTYGELGALLECDAVTARDNAVHLLLDRRRSRDGNTRVKLSPKLADMFFERLARAWIDRELAASAADLAAVRERMGPRRDEAAWSRTAVAG
jgi:hypothetical protein